MVIAHDTEQDLRQAAALGLGLAEIDALLGEALEAMGRLVPFDLATIMELDGEELSVRVARGPLDGPAVRRHSIALTRFPTIRRVLEEGHARAFVEHDHADGDGDPFDGVIDLEHGHFCMVAPLKAGEATLGLMTMDRADCGVYPARMVELAEVFAGLVAMVISYGEQSRRLDDVRRALEAQNRALSESAPGPLGACRLLEAAISPVMHSVVGLARQVASTDAPVLITGETGTGKEVLASAIHGWSARADRPLVSVNCGALPVGLIESELFGHVRGAFSGATQSRLGRFQAADGGTIFLDEIGEMPPEVQVKLLRVLQEGAFEPVGSDRTVHVDVRVIAATNRALREPEERRNFREDLYYRLAVFPLHLPPLRQRREDIPQIARDYLASRSRRRGRGPWVLTAADEASLAARDWPGNVRQLINTLERATIVSAGPALDLTPGDGPRLAPVPRGVDPDDEPVLPWDEMARRHIERALRRAGGKLYGPGGAAALLGIKPTTLASRMKKLGVQRPSGD